MKNRDILHERAENMRRLPTFHEKKFRDRLELAGIFFTSQKVIGRYIVDFCIGRTIVEIDGASHYEADQAQYDSERTTYLKGLGYSVIRVRNENVVSFDMNLLKQKPNQPRIKDTVQRNMEHKRRAWAIQDAKLKARRKEAKENPVEFKPTRTQAEMRAISEANRIKKAA